MVGSRRSAPDSSHGGGFATIASQSVLALGRWRAARLACGDVLCSRVPPRTGEPPQDRRNPPGRAPTPSARPPREEIVLRRARMTKAAALLLAGSLALAACASDENDGGSASGDSSESGGDLKIGLAYDTGGRGDRSFNDSAYAGVEAAIKENGGEVSELSPNADASNRADLLSQLADDGYNPVIAVGFAYGADF